MTGSVISRDGRGRFGGRGGRFHMRFCQNEISPSRQTT